MLSKQHDQIAVPIDIPPNKEGTHGFKAATEKARRALSAYCIKLELFPLRILAVYVVLLAVIIGAGWRPLEVDIDFHAFMRADGEAAKLADCYEHASGAREEKQDRRSLTDEALDDADADLGPEFAEYKLHLIYKALDGNALDDGPLRNVRDLEWRMRQLQGWRKVCSEEVAAESRLLCDPGESLANYLWPSPYRDPSASRDGKDKLFQVRFDGRGSERIPMAMAVAYLRSFPDGDITSKFLPKGFGDYGSMSSPVLRSQFTFRFYIGSASDPKSLKAERSRAAQEKYEELVRDSLYPLLSDPKQGEVDDDDFYIQVFYHGPYIQEHEVYAVLTGDVLLSLGAFILVLAYTWYHIGSVLLSVSGLLIVFAAIPVAYIVTPASKVSLASFLSLFIIIGIGSDFIFVFTDIWDQNLNAAEVIGSSSDANRLWWTIERAGKICMAAAFTTAASFYANLASVLRPLREFGFFMGTGIIVCFLLIVVFYPIFLLLSQRTFQACKRRSKPVVVDISEMSNLAVVPAAGEQLSLRESREKEMAEATSPRLRLLGRLVDFSRRRRRGILTCLCITLLVFIITISVLSEIDVKTPEIFPEGHNQVAVKDLMEHFEPAITSNGSGWDANACSPNVTGTCMLHWCEAPGPWDTPRDECSCIMRPVSGMVDQSTCDTVDIKSRISASGKLPVHAGAFKRQFAAHLQQAALHAVEVGSDTAPGYLFSHEGYWAKPYSDEGYTSSIQECAERCSLDEGCAGFNRIHVQGKCFLYNNDMGEKKLMPESNNQAYLKGTEGKVLFKDGDRASFTQLSMLALEDWETGEIATHSFVEGPQATIKLDIEKLNSTSRVANTTCNVEELCFCGGPVCAMSGWQNVRAMLKLEATTSERLLAEDKFHQVPSSAGEVLSSGGFSRALTGSSSGKAAPLLTVTLVYGLLPSTDGPPMFGNYKSMWSFDARFEPENPWAQRAMLKICEDVPEHLQVSDIKCWPQDFRSWLNESSKRFPTREFHTDLLEFISDSKQSVWKQYLWIRGGQMLAGKVDFNARYSNELPGTEALDLMDRWNAFVTDHNRKSSVTANVAWHTSQTWVRAEAEAAIKSSMVNTIVISVFCAFLVMVLFTQNLLLASCIIVIVSCVICGLSFFMVAIMGWAIGAIEAISLVVLVGYSMTYSMHIASIFGQQVKQTLPPQSAEISESCVRASVLQIGGAVVGSAVTTLISSFFLLFCTLQVFFRLGIGVLIVNLLSVALALVVLPACLVAVWNPGMSLFNRIMGCLTQCLRKKPIVPEDSYDSGDTENDFETVVPGRPVP